jgi:hypothetical protein
MVGVVSSPPNPQAGGSPPVGCPRLLIEYIRSYPPYLEAVSSIRNLRTRHAVVTVDPLNMDFKVHTQNMPAKSDKTCQGSQFLEAMLETITSPMRSRRAKLFTSKLGSEHVVLVT